MSYSEKFFIDSMKDVHKEGLELDNRIRLKHYLLVTYCYLRSYFPPKNNKVKVVIFGQGRSGSTLLENLIENTGEFRARGEIIRPFRKILNYPKKFIRGYSSQVFRENFIFHVKIYHLYYNGRELIPPLDFLQSLEKDGWKIIYLKRENTLRQCISNQIAMISKTWFFERKNLIRKKYHLDLNSLERQMDMRLCFLEKEKEVLESIEHIQLKYEVNLLRSEEHQPTIDKVFDFLGLKKSKTSTRYKKGGGMDLDHQISNYKELIELTKKRGWEHYLQSI